MVKAFLERGNGKKALLLGLSRKNCEQLLAGRPILPIRLLDFGVNVDLEIIIVGGETEKDIQAELMQHGVL